MSETNTGVPASATPKQPVPEAEAAGAAVDDLPGGLAAGIESILMVIDEPVGTGRLAEVLEVSEERVTAALRGLQAQYDGGDTPRGFELRELAGGWRIFSDVILLPLFHASSSTAKRQD